MRSLLRIGDVYALDVVRAAARQVPQQVRIHGMITVRTAHIGLWPEGNQAHLLHLALNPLAANDCFVAPKLLANTQRAIEGMRREQLVKGRFKASSWADGAASW